MQISEIDVSSAAEVERWYSVMADAHRHDRPESPFWSLPEAVELLRHGDPESRVLAFVANDTDRAVGASLVFVPRFDNLEKVYGEIAVAPASRRRGVGTELVEHLRGLVRHEGRSVLIVEAWLPLDADHHHPVRSFAASQRFRVAATETRNDLVLPIPEERLTALELEARTHSDGYDIATFVDTVPDELVESLVALDNQLIVDAPTGEISYEASAKTPDMWQEQIDIQVGAGRRLLHAVAIAGTPAGVVAYTMLMVPPDGERLPFAQQWGTYVDRAHRGRRLGLAVKLANLAQLRERFPERTRVTTTNAPDNRAMLAVNESLGFRPIETMAEFLAEI